MASVIHPFTDLRAHQANGPIVITRGEGVRVFDDAGRGYIDTVAGLWCASLGFSNERLVEAAAAQMRKLPYYHVFTGKSHEPTIELAEMLLERAPVPMGKVFFANSGSEANDTAIKLVWYYNNALGRHGKKKIISRLKAYHGITVAASSLTGLPNNHRSFDVPLPGFLHVATPHFYHGGHEGETEEQFSARLADELEQLILAEGPETVAAFWAEPVMGAGGVFVPPRGYFERIQAVLRKYDVLMVADEVINGFWRTGQYWGSQTCGVEPDILVCAKALSAAYLPISAVLVSAKVFEGVADESSRIGTFGTGYTYTGHPVAAAVAIETLRQYDELRIGEHVADVGPHLQAGLRARFAEHPLVGEVRGVGLIAAVELVEDRARRRNFDPARKMGARAQKLGEARGVIGRACANDVLAFSPPLIITKAEIDEVLDAFSGAFDALAAEVRHEARAAA